MLLVCIWLLAVHASCSVAVEVGGTISALLFPQNHELILLHLGEKDEAVGIGQVCEPAQVSGLVLWLRSEVNDLECPYGL